MEDQEINLYDVALMIRRKWRIIGIITAATTLLALAVALFSTPIYRASVVLAPVSTEVGGSSLSSLSGSLGGLASIAGLGTTESGAVDRNIATLRSRVLADRFIAERGLRRILFQDKWNEREQRWETSFSDRMRAQLSRFLANLTGESLQEPSGDGGPSDEQTYLAFSQVRSVALDEETGLVTLSMEWRNRNLAAEWANAYVKAANEYIRSQEIREAQNRLEYLANQARGTTLSEIRNAVTTLMEDELKRSMIANVREEFAFKIIDPAKPPELRSWPKRTLLVLLGIMGGIILGIAFILVQHYLDVMRHARER